MGSFLPGPAPREELEAVTSRHFTVNHGQKRFNAWTYEKIPATRTAIDAIIQDLQDRVRTAKRSRRDKRSRSISKIAICSWRGRLFAWNAPEQFGDHMIPDERELHKNNSDSSCTYASACGSGGSDSGEGSSSDGSGSSCGDGSSCGRILLREWLWRRQLSYKLYDNACL